MKKLISIVLILCLSLPFAVPALAAPQDNEIMPYGSLSIRGGMKYETTSGKYVIYGLSRLLCIEKVGVHGFMLIQ